MPNKCFKLRKKAATAFSHRQILLSESSLRKNPYYKELYVFWSKVE